MAQFQHISCRPTLLKALCVEDVAHVYSLSLKKRVKMILFSCFFSQIQKALMMSGWLKVAQMKEYLNKLQRS